jgi:putative FmdB family regulatory protein
MPTYEYACKACGTQFEVEQKMSDPALTKCPQCDGAVKRIISGGIGFIMHHSGTAGGGPSADHTAGCAYEQSGRTCCGRSRRCDTPGCESD